MSLFHKTPQPVYAVGDRSMTDRRWGSLSEAARMWAMAAGVAVVMSTAAGLKIYDGYGMPESTRMGQVIQLQDVPSKIVSMSMMSGKTLTTRIMHEPEKFVVTSQTLDGKTSFTEGVDRDTFNRLKTGAAATMVLRGHRLFPNAKPSVEDVTFPASTAGSAPKSRPRP